MSCRNSRAREPFDVLTGGGHIDQTINSEFPAFSAPSINLTLTVTLSLSLCSQKKKKSSALAVYRKLNANRSFFCLWRILVHTKNATAAFLSWPFIRGYFHSKETRCLSLNMLIVFTFIFRMQTVFI